MNKKLFLGLILLFSLLFNVFLPVIEGYECSYEDGGSLGNNDAPIVGRTKNSCQTAGIYKNGERLKDVEEKLNELTTLAKKVEQNVDKNLK